MFTHVVQPGQERTWDGRPIGTKHVLADVRDQRGEPGMLWYLES